MHKRAHIQHHFSPMDKQPVSSLTQTPLPNKITLFSFGLSLILTLVLASHVSASPRDQYKRIYDRLAGVPPTPTVMQDMITAGTPEAAANLAMQNPNFYNVTLKNFATPWTNEAQSVFEPLNDYSATIIGMIRDDKDFRQILYADIIYTGNITPAYANNSNQHYVALENRNIDLSQPSNLVERTQSSVTGLPANATAGVITSRASARAFFVDGTNRGMFRFTVLNHLCQDLEQIKDNTRTADRVRQDASRSPGGDSRLYLTNCLGCHAGMDPMTQAYAYYEWGYKDINPDNPDVGRLIYTPGVVQEKYLINANNFKGGYITPDDSWSNYWRRGPNAWLGWGDSPQQQVTLDDKGVSSGVGAKSLGEELAHSDAFARCQVKKVFKAVCLRAPDSDDVVFDGMVSDFKADYNMKGAFRRAAVHCRGQ